MQKLTSFKFNGDYEVCLENQNVQLVPLQQHHFTELYLVASDPLIWEQHPNPNRYQLPDFTNFFKGAIESDNAFLIVEKATNGVMGCTRFYDFDPEKKSVYIGYTFLGRNFWGKGFNQQVKKLLMDYAFETVDSVLFQIGSLNIRSQVAIGRTGGIKIGEQLVEYFGETPKMNFVYEVLK